MNNEKTRTVAILIFDEVEVLDFCGPFEVFSVTGRPSGSSPFQVVTVAQVERSIQTCGGLSVFPRYNLHACPVPDILLIPGGRGTRRLLENEEVLQWILRIHAEESCRHIMSVCTGALVLAQARLLGNQPATTHHEHFELLRNIDPSIEVREDQRIVDNGRIITSGGISAGIDAALHLVARLLGQAVAQETAERMEYRWELRRSGVQASRRPE